LSIFSTYNPLPKLDVNSFVGSLARSGNVSKIGAARSVMRVSPRSIDHHDVAITE
jgi:hypothetical protein